MPGRIQYGPGGGTKHLIETGNAVFAAILARSTTKGFFCGRDEMRATETKYYERRGWPEAFWNQCNHEAQVMISRRLSLMDFDEEHGRMILRSVAMYLKPGIRRITGTVAGTVAACCDALDR